MKLENLSKSFRSPICEQHFLKLSRSDVAKQQSYTCPCNRSMTPKNRKFRPKNRFFWRTQNIEIFDQIGRFRALGVPKNTGPPTEEIRAIRRVVAPKVNTGRGAIADTNAHASYIRLRCLRALGALTISYSEKCSGPINSDMSWLGPVLI